MARQPVVDIHAHFVPEGYLPLIETDRRLQAMDRQGVGALAGVEGLSPGDRARLLGGNVRRLLGLD